MSPREERLREEARQFVEASIEWQRRHDACEPVRPGHPPHWRMRDIAQDAARDLLAEADAVARAEAMTGGEE